MFLSIVTRLWMSSTHFRRRACKVCSSQFEHFTPPQPWWLMQIKLLSFGNFKLIKCYNMQMNMVLDIQLDAI